MEASHPTPSKRGLKIVLPALVLLVMIGAFMLMKTMRPKQPIAPPQPEVVKVNTTPLVAKNQAVVIASQGLIEPAYQTVLNAELAAKVTWVSPNFEPGEYVKKGQVLSRFDAREAQSELEQAQAALMNAEVALSMEESRAALAQQEWELLQADVNVSARAEVNLPTAKTNPSALTLRQPQLKAAQASVKGNQARVNRAKMLVERAELTAPYNAYIVERAVSPGQTVLGGNRLGEVIGADQLRLRLPVGLEDVAKINASNAPVVVSWQNEGKQWSAPMTRLGQKADALTRKVDLIIDINPRHKNFAGLRAGLFVTANIAAGEQAKVFAIPRIVLNKSERVPLAVDGRLIWKAVDFIGGDGENRWVAADALNDGDQLASSSVQAFPTGTKIDH